MAKHQFTSRDRQGVRGFGRKSFGEAWDAMYRQLTINEDLVPCTYCGVRCDTIDHVPPQSVRPRLIALGLWKRYPFITVPACRECNCALGAKSLFTVEARRTYMRKWLRCRYAAILRIPNWSDSELSDLQPAFRNYVVRGVVLREWMKERLSYQGQ